MKHSQNKKVNRVEIIKWAVYIIKPVPEPELVPGTIREQISGPENLMNQPN